MIEKFTSKIKNLGLSKSEKIAIAVSGGSDSTALCFLCAQAELNVTGVIVDHGYRKNSAEEAREVKKYIEKTFGIKCIILTNKREVSNNNIENDLRDIRFTLLFDHCRKNNIKTLFTAHHLDDQIETFLMRLERGSGLDGLVGIKELNIFEGISVIRPLLDYTKKELTNILLKNKIKWVEDPSNKDLKLTRNNIRKTLEGFSDYDLMRKRLSGVISNLERAKDFIEDEKNNALQKIAAYSKLGYVQLELKPFIELHEELRLRILRDIIGDMAASEKHIRLDKLKTINESVTEPYFKSKTLYGVEVFKNKDWLYFIKELNGLEPAPAVKGELIWNHNFRIIVKKDYTNCYIAPSDTLSFSKGMSAKITKTFPSLVLKRETGSKKVEKAVFSPHMQLDRKYNNAFEYEFFLPSMNLRNL